MDFQPLSRRPAFRTAFGLGLAVVGYILLRRSAGPESLALSWLDPIVFTLGLVGTLGLASQFVLPVRRWPDRAASLRRLFGYGLGERGPVLFIENGRALETSRDRRGGAGVLLIGQASAAVLRTDVSYTRAVGPGVVFTVPGERLAEAVDLRRQVRTQRGRPASGPAPTALTRDGIPISADLTITFMLDPGHTFQPREGIHPFEFHAQSAVRAVYGHAYGEAEDVPWTELPLRLAADIWRERVKSRPIAAWFRAERESASTLEDLRNEILARLQDSTETSEAGPQEARLLRDRGIRVLDVQVGNVYLPEAIRRERIEEWTAHWGSAHAQEIAEVAALDQSLRKQATDERALSLAFDLTPGLRRALAGGQPPGPRETLHLITIEALRRAADRERLPHLAPLAEHLMAMADEIATSKRTGPAPGEAMR